MAIYVIEAVGSWFVKIGFTDGDPMERLESMQTGNPHTLRLLAYFEGDLSKEKELHKQFEYLRYRGEWFHLDQDIIRFLSEVKQIMIWHYNPRGRTEKCRRTWMLDPEPNQRFHFPELTTLYLEQKQDPFM